MSLATLESEVPSDRARCRSAIVANGRLFCDAPLEAITRASCPDRLPIAVGSRIDADCSVQADPTLMRALSLPVDVNTAELDALRTLPGIGPVLALRIVQARPFASVDALQSVSGIGPATVRRIASRAYVAPRESSHPATRRPNSGPRAN